ncbi:unnamed protein product [Linum trigynum]|uniref:Uncharacterized protein n=1 Tax=Linum trigynum TaxID=586398 RepID=A0AAV2GNV2_9ROSI
MEDLEKLRREHFAARFRPRPPPRTWEKEEALGEKEDPPWTFEHWATEQSREPKVEEVLGEKAGAKRKG